MCLLGSVVIVLHAPPDKPVETIDEILEYAMSPGSVTLYRRHIVVLILIGFRFLVILCSGGHFLDGHDLPGRPSPRKEEPTDLHLHLLDRWLRFCHVYQSVRHCFETHLQP